MKRAGSTLFGSITLIPLIKSLVDDLSPDIQHNESAAKEEDS